MIVSLLHVLNLATSSSGSQYTPTFPGGILVAWLICNGAKRNQIGGWLLFFYWQLYAGILMTAAFFAMNIQSYIPENFESTGKYLLFLASAVPDILLYLVMLTVGTLLLVTRTWDVLKLLRWVIGLSLAVKIAGLVIDAIYFPDSNELEALTYISIISSALWLAYLFRSVRVKHVFKTHDWEIAVNSIYPVKPKVAT